MNDSLGAPAGLLRQVPRSGSFPALVGKPRPIVLVVGPPQSGMSLCAYVLSLLGLDIGGAPAADPSPGIAALAEADDADSPIAAFHRRALELFDRAPANPLCDFTLPVAWWADARLAPLRRDMVAFVDDRIASGQFGFADPDTMRLLPLWRQIIAALGLTPKIVLCLRNPASLARQLYERDGLDAELVEYRWFVHMTDFFRYADKLDHCVVAYEDWFDGAAANLEKLQGFLGLEWQQGDVDRGLVLSRIAALTGGGSETQVPEPRQPIIRSFYELARNPLGGQDGPRQREQIVQQFVAFQQLQRPIGRALAAHAAAIAEITGERDRHAGACDVLGAELSATRTILAERDAALGRTRAELKTLGTRIAERDAAEQQLQARLADTEALLASIRSERDAAASARTESEAARQALDDIRRAAEERIVTLEKALEATGVEIAARNHAVAQLEVRFAETEALLATARSEAEALLATARTEREAVSTVLVETQAARERLEAELADRQQELHRIRLADAERTGRWEAGLQALRVEVLNRDREKENLQLRLQEQGAALAAAQSERDRVRASLTENQAARQELASLITATRQEVEELRISDQRRAELLEAAQQKARAQLARANENAAQIADLQSALSTARQVGKAVIQALAGATAIPPVSDPIGWFRAITRPLAKPGAVSAAAGPIRHSSTSTTRARFSLRRGSLGRSLKRRKESVITRADRAAAAQEWDLALSLYRQALDRNPRNPPIWVQCGHVLKETGRLQEAEAAYRRAIGYEPQQADHYLHLGHVLKLQGRGDEARTAYMRAFALNSSSSEVVRELAEFGWGEERLSQFREVVQFPVSDPVSPAARKAGGSTRRSVLRRASVITLADLARDTGDWTRAARLYRKALERNPHRLAIWVQYGHALKEQGRVAEAEAAYRTAIAQDPKTAEPWRQLGDALKQQARSDEAEALYLCAFALDPQASFPLDELQGLGWSAAKTGELAAMIGAETGEEREPACENDAAATAGAAPEQATELSEQALALSERFDREWYLRRYPDVARSGIDPFEHFIANGSAEGRAPNPLEAVDPTIIERFDAVWYLNNYPDVRASGMPPFRHFLLHGHAEGRKPNADEATTGPSKPACDAAIRCLKEPRFGREIALFVSHSPRGRLKPHIHYYMENFKRQGVSVILIIAADRPVVSVDDEISNCVDGIFVRANEGYDFAAWAHILSLYPEIFDAETLYLVNDSVIGPTNHNAFADLIRKIRAARGDVIGLTENHERCWHFQSYFLAIKQRALASTVFQKFVADIVSYEQKEDVVNQYEIRLIPSMKAAGLVCECLFSAPGPWNPPLFHWKYLLESGFPFLKVATIRGDHPNVDIGGWPAMLDAQGYDSRLATALLEQERTDAAASLPDPVGNQPSACAPPIRSAESRIAFIGPWNYNNGLGTASRGYISALRHAKLQVNLHSIKSSFHIHNRIIPPVDICDFSGPADFAIVHLNPDSWSGLLTETQRGIIARARTVIGLWVWEMSDIPNDWIGIFDEVDAIWVPSQYCADIFRSASNVPVEVIPHVVPVPAGSLDCAEKAIVRSGLGLAENEKIMLYAFDGASYLARKNPFALIRCFVRSGLGERGWRLILKSKNLFDSHEQGVRLQRMADETPGVILINRATNKTEMEELMRAADIYASPHCSEGFGLTIAEAMALGKIVVATDYGGSHDFLDETCGFPVRYRLQPPENDFGHYTRERGVWAHIDEDHLTACLTAASERLAEGDGGLGAAACARIGERFSPSAVAKRMQASLSALENATAG